MLLNTNPKCRFNLPLVQKLYALHMAYRSQVQSKSQSVFDILGVRTCNEQRVRLESNFIFLQSRRKAWLRAQNFISTQFCILVSNMLALMHAKDLLTANIWIPSLWQNDILIRVHPLSINGNFGPRRTLKKSQRINETWPT